MMVEVVVIEDATPMVGADKVEPVVTAEVVKFMEFDAIDVPLLFTD